MGWIEWIEKEALWLSLFLFIWILFLFAYIFFKKMFVHLARKKNFQKHWQQALLHALKAPIYVALWIFAILLSLEVIAFQLIASSFVVNMDQVHGLIVTVLVSWCGLRWVGNLRKRLINHVTNGVERAKVDIVCKGGILLIWIIGILSVLQIIGFNIQTLAAIGGLSGFSLAFAAKDVIANFFGGIMIYLTHPFAVGDEIRSPDRKIDGTVSDISWYFTTIEGGDKQPIYVPNSLFSTIVLINRSRMSHWIIEERVNLRLSDLPKLPVFIKEFKEELEKYAAIDHTQRIYVYVDKIEDTGLELAFKVATKATDRMSAMPIQQEIFLLLYQILQKHQIQFATSTMQVLLNHV